MLMNSLLYPVKIVAVHLPAEGFNVLKIIVIKPCRGHVRTAFFAAAHRFTDNIKKDLAWIVVDHDLLYLGNELVKISRIEAHHMIAGVLKIGSLADIRRFDSQPIVMLNRVLFIKACRDIHGSTNSDFLAGFKLSLEKVEFQCRIHCVDFCRMI